MGDVRKLLRIMTRYWKLMTGGFLTMSIFALLSGLTITMFVPLFDFVFGPKHKESLITSSGEFLDKMFSVFGRFFATFSLSGLFSSESYKGLLGDIDSVLSMTDPSLLLLMIGVAMITLMILKNSIYFLNRVIFVTLRGKVIRRLRNIIFRKFLELPMVFFMDKPLGDIQVRITADVNIVSDLFIRSVFGSLRDFALVIIYVLIALFINAKLFLYTVVIVPVFSLMISYVGNKIRKYSKRIQNTYAILFSRIAEVISGIKIVKSYAREEYENEKFRKENDKFYRAWFKAQMYSAFNIPLSEINGTIVGIIVLIIGGNMVLSDPGNFTLGSFTAFLFAIFSLLQPLKSLTTAYTEVRKAMVSLTRIFEILNLPPELKDDSDSVEKKSFEDSIRIEHLGFSYDKGRKILDDINLEIKKGQTVALVGSSGAGKTTLINLIERFFDPQEGRITIDGVDLKNIRSNDLHDLFGTVTQESILFNDTVANNIAYGTNRDITIEDIKKAAEIGYADDFIKDMPIGYNTMINPKASNLSGGQRQRLCISRAIVGDPPILIFDEATSSLDTESEHKVQKAIEMATKDRTVIVIAHRLSTIMNSDRIIVMDEGKIVGSGTHDELMSNNDKYRTLYECDFKDPAGVDQIRAGDQDR
ncbi:MAG: ABC transporter ATP-binding protein [Candidatus Krumholzibacteriota bacterium]|nr:ABC transporter ATP-binding protein [Candidatus Krumholzibacteriota bacterium]